MASATACRTSRRVAVLIHARPDRLGPGRMGSFGEPSRIEKSVRRKFYVGDWVEVMRLDGDDVRYGEIVACWARLSPAELCGFESWYRINFGSESVRNEMDVPDTEIVDALPQ